MRYLKPDDVHVWVSYPDELLEQTRFDRCYRLLCERERARYHSFVFDKDRRLYLAAHAQVRSALSFYADVTPADWRFAVNRYGRPAISGAHGSRIHFSLSHTDGLIASAFARREEVGVDVESITVRDATLDIARTMFARSEFDDLSKLPTALQRRRFFELWTLKEAYIKAKGMGLSLALDQFWFKLAPDGISIQFDQRLNDTPQTWQFETYQPTASHQMALAVRRGENRLRVRVQRFPPESL